MTVKARVIDGSGLSSGDIAAWRALIAASDSCDNAFLSPAFTLAASKAYGRVKVCFIEDPSGVVGVFPYQFMSAFSQAMGAAVRVGEEMSDRFSVIARPAFRCTAQELLSLAGLNHLYFTHLEESQNRHGLMGEKPNGGLRILMPQGGAAYFDDLRRSDAKFSKDTERRLRKAVQDLGAVRFCLAESDPAAWLPRVIAEKRAQYLRTKNQDWLGIPGRKELLEALARTQEPDCSPVVSTLMFGETWAAIHFGIKAGKTLHYWFPVYNPALSSYAPGRLLLYHVILNAATAGIEIIDRGEGESQAKQDFPSERQVFYSGVWHRPGLRSFIYRAHQSLSWRLSSLRKT